VKRIFLEADTNTLFIWTSCKRQSGSKSNFGKSEIALRFYSPSI